MSRVTIFTKAGCPYCAAARKHFIDRDIEFEEIDVHDTQGAIDKVKTSEAARTWFL